MIRQSDLNPEGLHVMNEENQPRMTLTFLIADSVANEESRTKVIRQHMIDIPNDARYHEVAIRGARDGESLQIRVKRVGLHPNTGIEWSGDQAITNLDFLEYEVTRRVNDQFERSR